MNELALDDGDFQRIERRCHVTITLAPRDQSKTALRTTIDSTKMALELEDVQNRCLCICEQQNDNTVGGTEGTREFERYTPAEYIDAAREETPRRWPESSKPHDVVGF